MSKVEPKNVSASIRQRLLNLSQTSKRPFQEILQYYAMERFIHRFAQSPYKNKLILKGGLMFYVWNLSASRPTRDIDFLGITPNNPDNIQQIVTDICQIDYPQDGLTFINDSIQCEAIQEQNEYSGIRATLLSKLSQANIKLQIDIGFGDIVHPNPTEFEYPTLLNMHSPCIKGYTATTLIAEKFHTMLRHGTHNSRMKDFYDIWILSRQFDFSGESLQNAITKTFNNRHMDLKKQELLIFTNDFKHDKNRQWNAFIQKSNLTIAPNHFNEVMNQIEPFLSPLLQSCKTDMHFNYKWQAPGPWMLAI